MPSGCEKEASARVFYVRRRGEPECLLRELGGRRRRAAGVCRSRRLLEDHGCLTIRLDRREGKVPSSFLCRGNELCKPSVQGPSLRRGLTCGGRGSQQRMRETQALSIKLENPRSQHLGQAGFRMPSDDRFHEWDGRL